MAIPPKRPDPPPNPGPGRDPPRRFVSGGRSPSRVQASRAPGLGARALPHAPARLDASPARVLARFHRRIAGELLAGLLARLADFSAERAVAGVELRPAQHHARAHVARFRAVHQQADVRLRSVLPAFRKTVGQRFPARALAVDAVADALLHFG